MSDEVSPILKLPSEILEICLLLLDRKTLQEVCRSHSVFSNLCNNESFWKRKVQRDFGKVYKPSITTWKDVYSQYRLLEFEAEVTVKAYDTWPYKMLVNADIMVGPFNVFLITNNQETLIGTRDNLPYNILHNWFYKELVDFMTSPIEDFRNEGIIDIKVTTLPDYKVNIFTIIDNRMYPNENNNVMKDIILYDIMDDIYDDVFRIIEYHEGHISEYYDVFRLGFNLV